MITVNIKHVTLSSIKSLNNSFKPNNATNEWFMMRYDPNCEDESTIFHNFDEVVGSNERIISDA